MHVRVTAMVSKQTETTPFIYSYTILSLDPHKSPAYFESFLQNEDLRLSSYKNDLNILNLFSTKPIIREKMSIC